MLNNHTEVILFAGKRSTHGKLFVVDGEEGGLAVGHLLLFIFVAFLLLACLCATERPLIISDAGLFPQKFVHYLLVIVVVLGLRDLLVSNVVCINLVAVVFLLLAGCATVYVTIRILLRIVIVVGVKGLLSLVDYDLLVILDLFEHRVLFQKNT